jgi:NAD(P)-dependent dehydrogenase (short-subunit alcohol dehydrogenase family)
MASGSPRRHRCAAPFTAALAREHALVRVNLIAAGFVDTPLSASLLEGPARGTQQ